MGNHLSIRVCRSMILFHVLDNRYPFAFKKVYKTIKKMLKANQSFQKIISIQILLITFIIKKQLAQCCHLHVSIKLKKSRQIIVEF